MEEEKEKVELEEGLKPVPGIPSNYGGVAIRQLDDNGSTTNILVPSGKLDLRNPKVREKYPEPVRMGDYYYDENKNLQVWENSPTDLLQKYTVAVGGTEKPVETVSLKNEGLGILSGATLGSMLPGPAAIGGAVIGGVIGGLSAHNTAAEEALKQWQEQDVKYDTAIEFYKDDDGTI